MAGTDPHGAPDRSSDGSAGGDVPFDPYRYGRPETPPPPEYAPPGYVPDPPPPGDPRTGSDRQPGPAPWAGLPQWDPPSGQGPTPPPYAPVGWRPGQPAPSNGRAIASMVLGIVSIVLCVLSVFDIVPIVLAVVYGRLGLRVARQTGSGRGMAVAGIVCALVGAVLVVLVQILYSHLEAKCGSVSTHSSAFGRCVSRNL